MSADGNWNILLKTPMGDRKATLSLKAAGDTLTGKQGGDQGSVDIFEGKVAGSRFKIHRVAGYQNSFLPIIEGSFRRDGLATTVAVNMRLVWPVVPVWIGIVIFLAWSSVSVDSPVAGPFGVRMVVIAMTLFIYLVATVPFAIESRIAMKRLLDLLRAGSSGSELSF